MHSNGNHLKDGEQQVNNDLVFVSSFIVVALVLVADMDLIPPIVFIIVAQQSHPHPFSCFLLNHHIPVERSKHAFGFGLHFTQWIYDWERTRYLEMIEAASTNTIRSLDIRDMVIIDLILQALPPSLGDVVRDHHLNKDVFF
ncbi:hypothetical protein O0I10_011447 [Lichtheimia ornata]|uniref:Uncharacterized protein n=1 Tax=Lichtheimia ornata TaxID=688661 RepID=A0AAD7XU27_9FUNG|nr:uncharacterized protein O0I10_011447 [Lichtheimia ornata]KAJ8652913.1 hypothetical protein O0I10_011447 [Lichtheimia ornata]